MFKIISYKSHKGFTLIDPSRVTDRIRVNKAFTLIDPSRVTGGTKVNNGFTLIELLVVISIIALLSTVVVASMTKARIKARDAQRISNARQLSLALEQYETTNNTYKLANTGANNTGTGYVAKSGSGGYTTSIISALKSAGVYSSTNLKDPVFGTDNYYLGVCTSTNAYNIFVKLEQSQYNNATTTISPGCGGVEAASLGFSYVANTGGGVSGGASFGAMDPIVDKYGLSYGVVTGEDGRVWLDRNLGAPRVPTSNVDYQAFGSLFQWGRADDGHELIVRTSVVSATAVNGDTLTQSPTDTPPNNLFIKNLGYGDWRSSGNSNLWQGASGINNPCPSGFRLPTFGEQLALVNASGITNSYTAYTNTVLKLTGSGTRVPDTAAYVLNGDGNYWTSTYNGGSPNHLWFNGGSINVADNDGPAYGFSVRCIK